MIDDVKETVESYAIIAAILSLCTAAVRPFVSVKQSIRDTIIVFTFTVLAGVIFEGLDMNPYFKLGFSGCVGFWSVRLYEVGCALLTHLKNHPDKLIKKLDRE